MEVLAPQAVTGSFATTLVAYCEDLAAGVTVCSAEGLTYTQMRSSCPPAEQTCAKGSLAAPVCLSEHCSNPRYLVWELGKVRKCYKEDRVGTKQDDRPPRYQEKI